MTKKSSEKPTKASAVELEEKDLGDVQGGMETVSLNFAKIEVDYVGKAEPKAIDSKAVLGDGSVRPVRGQ